MNAVVSQSSTVTFRCKPCQYTFSAEPSRVEDAPERAHPYMYFAECPYCKDEVGQAYWEIGLYNAHLKATGPRTTTGKAKSASNLDGHPTPEATQHIRFNALKHGASAKTALFFPARPGKYLQCETCDVDHDYCREQPACVKRSELLMNFVAAMQSGNTEFLNEMHILNQSNLAALFQDMMLSVIQDGVVIRSPAYGFDKDGGCHTAEFIDDDGKRQFIEEVKAHPVLKPMLELMSKNNLTLGDLNLTPKVQTDQGIQAGNLKIEEDDRESLAQYQQGVQKQLGNLKEMINRSQARLNSDPVYLEYAQENPDDMVDVVEVVDE